MATLPFDRYTGTEQPCAVDADGTVFFAFQGPNNTGRLVMISHGAATDITDLVVPAAAPRPLGRPNLDTSATHLGLWFIGNQEVAANITPPRYKVPQFKPFT